MGDDFVTLEMLVAYAAVVVVLVMVPGPVVGLVVALGGSRGPSAAIAATLGASVSIALQLTAAALGLASIMALLGDLFELLRWVAAAYLIWLAYKTWRAPVTQGAPLPPMRAAAAFGQGFLVSSTNPKSLVFFAAFFPQFIDPTTPITPQLIALTFTFQVIFTTGVACYGLLAARLGAWLVSPPIARIRNKFLALVLGGSAALLATIQR